MERLQVERYYHIYNHANGDDNIFRNEENMRFFLMKYEEHVTPVVDNLAYSLLLNHFHSVVRIKSLLEYVLTGHEGFLIFLTGKLKYANQLADYQQLLKQINQNRANIPKGSNAGDLNSLYPELRKLTMVYEDFVSKQYSNFFSCYTQSFNKLFGRRGSLFMKPFKRKPVLSSNLRNLIIYVICNPLHHGFVTNIYDWKYTGPKIENDTRISLDMDALFRIFDGFENFKYSIENNRYTPIKE
ncbi:MAG: hypothetical protein PF448_02975 [Bacteroidales bacterium]|jgi:putative transposase|nr:hypothetical protein [Bacteroidales bacterium]